ncbi:Dihydrofolate reductase [Actinoplanes philippinensis]|uniref:Dihydrofolate reductase n=1 Tax=Actinoplanes philippinensis TaxID=35752 RepID=A0A1I2LA05_9ACTN|nr:dihydrofolate reductase family protein [Actinoplanes philippinensis]SFF74031.1 Dihydrofolate reductase [Actinoplanes philippinensis]
MTTLQYQCAMSLDGFIAGRDGDMSWLDTGTAPGETNPLVAQVGAVLSGARTYHGDDPNAGTEQEGGYDGQYTGPTIVLTHHVPPSAPPGVTFADDLGKAIELAREAAGDRLVSVLGADVARQCIAAGLLDEVLVHLIPVLLGDGVRLFDNPGGDPVRLEVLESGPLMVRARIVR